MGFRHAEHISPIGGHVGHMEEYSRQIVHIYCCSRAHFAFSVQNYSDRPFPSVCSASTLSEMHFANFTFIRAVLNKVLITTAIDCSIVPSCRVQVHAGYSLGVSEVTGATPSQSPQPTWALYEWGGEPVYATPGQSTTHDCHFFSTNKLSKTKVFHV